MVGPTPQMENTGEVGIYQAENHKFGFRCLFDIPIRRETENTEKAIGYIGQQFRIEVLVGDMNLG